jgi:hypothetical protein
VGLALMLHAGCTLVAADGCDLGRFLSLKSRRPALPSVLATMRRAIILASQLLPPARRRYPQVNCR